MEPTIWDVAGDLVDAMKAGLSILTTAPVSYMLVFGFVATGLSFAARKVLRKRKV